MEFVNNRGLAWPPMGFVLLYNDGGDTDPIQINPERVHF
jgi:hypothetical protein